MPSPDSFAPEFGQLTGRSVHTVDVHGSGRHPELHTPRWPAARWLLIGMVLSGLVAMHILSQHQAAGGHGMFIGHPQPASGVSGHQHQDEPTNGMPLTVSADHGAALAAPAWPAGSVGSMAACVLFLIVGGGAVLSTRSATGRARTPVDDGRLSSGRLDLAPRGPPEGAPPRISLCVLRV